MKKILTFCLLMVFIHKDAFPARAAALSVTLEEVVDEKLDGRLIIPESTVTTTHTGWLSHQKPFHFLQRFLFGKKFTDKVPHQGDGNDRPAFNLGGFALGLLYGPVGLLVAYLISKKEPVRKSAFLGFKIWIGLVVVVGLLIFAIAGGKFR